MMHSPPALLTEDVPHSMHSHSPPCDMKAFHPNLSLLAQVQQFIESCRTLQKNQSASTSSSLMPGLIQDGEEMEQEVEEDENGIERVVDMPLERLVDERVMAALAKCDLKSNVEQSRSPLKDSAAPTQNQQHQRTLPQRILNEQNLLAQFHMTTLTEQDRFVFQQLDKQLCIRRLKETLQRQCSCAVCLTKREKVIQSCDRLFDQILPVTVFQPFPFSTKLLQQLNETQLSSCLQLNDESSLQWIAKRLVDVVAEEEKSLEEEEACSQENENDSNCSESQHNAASNGSSALWMQLYLTRIYEWRVLAAWREKRALERQEQLLLEEEMERERKELKLMKKREKRREQRRKEMLEKDENTKVEVAEVAEEKEKLNQDLSEPVKLSAKESKKSLTNETKPKLEVAELKENKENKLLEKTEKSKVDVKEANTNATEIKSKAQESNKQDPLKSTKSTPNHSTVLASSNKLPSSEPSPSKSTSHASSIVSPKSIKVIGSGSSESVSKTPSKPSVESNSAPASTAPSISKPVANASKSVPSSQIDANQSILKVASSRPVAPKVAPSQTIASPVALNHNTTPSQVTLPVAPNQTIVPSQTLNHATPAVVPSQNVVPVAPSQVTSSQNVAPVAPCQNVAPVAASQVVAPSQVAPQVVPSQILVRPNQNVSSSSSSAMNSFVPNPNNSNLPTSLPGNNLPNTASLPSNNLLSNNAPNSSNSNLNLNLAKSSSFATNSFPSLTLNQNPPVVPMDANTAMHLLIQQHQQQQQFIQQQQMIQQQQLLQQQQQQQQQILQQQQQQQLLQQQWMRLWNNPTTAAPSNPSTSSFPLASSNHSLTPNLPIQNASSLMNPLQRTFSNTPPPPPGLQTTSLLNGNGPSLNSNLNTLPINTSNVSNQKFDPFAMPSPPSAAALGGEIVQPLKRSTPSSAFGPIGRNNTNNANNTNGSNNGSNANNNATAFQSFNAVQRPGFGHWSPW